ncbi:sulfate transporter CysZ [Litoribrevibacter albus]|uniref:Sulfate transporter CysZ n=1 Tax=Litoribrevibacter albus TaxID=1473156 RepID=A0AA37W7N0_9GAMM|nr:sulfate transporter CysZ [Litoribrevibacter albus]GLQ32785.1 sulfate transporter CysZ [Litoribrevibacter albus]
MLASLKRSFSLLISSDLRWYVLGPLLINITVFAGLGLYIFSWIPDWMMAAQGLFPEWLAWLSWLIAPLVVLAVIIVGISTFNIIGNILAAPLNAFLSEKVEKLELGERYVAPEERTIAQEAIHAVIREFRKLLYYLPRFLVLLIISFIPGVNLVAPFLWFAFGAWLMAFQYFDYPLDNRRYDFAKSRAWIHSRPVRSLSFGSVTSVLFMIPGVNLFMMPLCVVWATLLWLEEQKA